MSPGARSVTVREDPSAGVVRHIGRGPAHRARATAHPPAGAVGTSADRRAQSAVNGGIASSTPARAGGSEPSSLATSRPACAKA